MVIFICFSISSQSVIFSVKDAATMELQQRADVSSQVHSAASHHNQEKIRNDTERPVKLVTQNVTDTNVEIRSDDEVKSEIDKKGKENLTSTEEIPSFSEWTQKQLEEAEKKKVQGNVSTQNLSVNAKPSSGMYYGLIIY